MKNFSQLFLGLLSAIGSTVLVVAAATLALLEGGVAVSSVLPPTQTPVIATATPRPIEMPATPEAAATTAVPTPTEELHCQNTPADWLPYTVQQGDTILSLVIQSGVSTAEFLKANCFMSDSLPLEPGWVVYLPPTAPTATATMTSTPELPTSTLCAAPYGWVNYVVRRGDTLFRISLSVGITQYELQMANCLPNTTIYTGQVLRVPRLPPEPPLATGTPTPTRTPEISDTPIPPTWTDTPIPSDTPVTPVGKQDQNITFTSPPDQVYGNPPISVNATASSGLPVTLSAAGNCTIAGTTVTLNGAGSCSITAEQPGNASFNAALPVTRTFRIAKASQTIDFNPPADKTVGDPQFAVTATASSGLLVRFSAAGNCSIAGSVVTVNSAGSCTITAFQDGDSNFEAAAPVSRTFQINQASQSITFGPLPNRTAADTPFAVSASASSGLPVSYRAAGNCTIAGSTVSLTGAGSCSITASQAGDSKYLPAADVTQTFQITS